MKHGFAFPDYIKTEKIHRLRQGSAGDGRTTNSASMRVFLFLFLFGFLIFVLVGRLLYIQLWEGQRYRTLSDTNRIRTTTVHAPRGILFDRNGKPLVYNVPGFRQKNGDDVTLLTRDSALPLYARGDKNLEIDTLRSYPFGEAFAHVLGYIGQISKEELAEASESDYKAGDVIGKMGIEKQYETTLAGIDGKMLVEIDSAGRQIRVLGQTDPIPGKNITLTLDSKLQQAVYDATKKVERGAVIVTNPKGEVLALLSRPAFDPNLFTLDNTYKPLGESSYFSITEILSDTTNQPFLNRAIGGVYPPGSTFKLVTAAAGLESGAVDENFEVVDNGIIHIGAFSFANWYFLEYGQTEGSISMVRAIARSNDIYFYKVAELTGVEKLSEMARKFSLGKRLGIDLEGEAKGTVPDDPWKREVIGEQWYLGDTYHYGIGQGYLLATPLQVNAWTQAIAHSGVVYWPHIVKEAKPTALSKPFLSEKTVSLIRQGMVSSCSTGGVAWPFFEFKVSSKGRLASGRKNLKIDGKNFISVPEASGSAKKDEYVKVSVACKTGTAQHGGLTDAPHAWITLFAPAYDPEIVVTVLVESGGQGSSVAGPIAKEIVEEWFSNTKQN